MFFVVLVLVSLVVIYVLVIKPKKHKEEIEDFPNPLQDTINNLERLLNTIRSTDIQNAPVGTIRTLRRALDEELEIARRDELYNQMPHRLINSANDYLNQLNERLRNE